MTALATTNGTLLAQHDEWTKERRQLVKDTVARDATDAELEMFISVCKLRKLDPFAGQILFQKRNQRDSNGNWVARVTIIVQIDGLRLQAQRTGEYQGQDAPEWCGSDGVWKEVWLEDKPPVAARVRVHRAGHVRPSTGIAKYDSFVQKRKDGHPNHTWAQLPDHMLAKVAEAHALRKAFPDECAGLYTNDEMGQADNDHRGTAPARDVVDAEIVEPPAKALPVDSAMVTVPWPKSEDYGKPLGSLPRAKLHSMRAFVAKAVEDPKRKRYIRENQELLDHIDTVIQLSRDAEAAGDGMETAIAGREVDPWNHPEDRVGDGDDDFPPEKAVEPEPPPYTFGRGPFAGKTVRDLSDDELGALINGPGGLKVETYSACREEWMRRGLK